ALLLEEPPQPELTGDAAEQCAGHEVDVLRGRQRLAVRVALERGDAVARVIARIAVDWIVVEDTENLCHNDSLPGLEAGPAPVRPIGPGQLSVVRRFRDSDPDAACRGWFGLGGSDRLWRWLGRGGLDRSFGFGCRRLEW